MIPAFNKPSIHPGISQPTSRLAPAEITYTVTVTPKVQPFRADQPVMVYDTRDGYASPALYMKPDTDGMSWVRQNGQRKLVYTDFISRPIDTL